MTNVIFTLKQRYLNVDMVNVFNYFRASTPIGQTQLEELVDDFYAKIVENMNAVQVAGVSNISVHAYRLDAGNISVSRALSGGGDIVVANSLYEPAFIAAGIRLNVSDTFDSETLSPPASGRVIRRGYKFIGGIDEGNVVNGAFDPTYLAFPWATLRSNLATYIAAAGAPTQTFVPVVMSSYPGDVIFPNGTSVLLAEVETAAQPVITSLRSRKR